MSDGEPSLDLWIIGGRLGESIVIRTPGGAFGVIDAYARQTDQIHDASNPTVSLLRTLGACELQFVGFTHPHQDHYRGLPGVFRAFSGHINEFWRPPFERASLLKALDQESKQDSFRGLRQAKTAAAQTLIEVLRLAKDERSRNPDSFTIKHVQERTRLLEEEEHGFWIEGMAPSAELVESYQEDLVIDLISGGTGANERHNKISSVIAIGFGQWSGILGGDTELQSWSLIISRYADQLHNSSFCKVSHHGSPTGSNDALWRCFSSSRLETVVTCFAAQGLPKRAVLDSIWTRGGVIHATTKRLAAEITNSELYVVETPPSADRLRETEARGIVHIKANACGQSHVSHQGDAQLLMPRIQIRRTAT